MPLSSGSLQRGGCCGLKLVTQYREPELTVGLDQGSVYIYCLFLGAPCTMDCVCRLHNPVGVPNLDYCVTVSISVEGMEN